MTEELIARRNEADANATAAKVMIITFIMLTLALLLNVAGIFIIPQWLMLTFYISGSASLLLPVQVHRIIGAHNSLLKYIYVTFSGLYLFVISTTITFHTVVIYAFPVAIAGIYFDKNLTVYATVLASVMTASGQILGFALGWCPDKNFPTWSELLMYSVLPRFLVLLCFSFLLMLLTRRTTKLLSDQIKDSKQILELHQDMIFGFATLVENRDEVTGGHVKRTSIYVELLAGEMLKRGIYEDIIDEDYVRNLSMAAPMHDIGKIAVPDNILLKPGKLTEEEFEQMKQHTIKGGQIIRETFGHVGSESYRRMTYEVVRHHHEKWNGHGYPDGLIGDDIPLSARIMTIADVFDAVSQDRCYRAALPLSECFDIIKHGRGSDFDPVIADVFLDIREQVASHVGDNANNNNIQEPQ